MLMSLLMAIVIGFIAGIIARAIHPGEDPAGFWVTAALGIGGSLLATFLGQALGMYAPGESAGFIMSVIGAIVILAIYTFIRRQRIKHGM